ncbi:heavy-metal-associated domain-containing protein [Ralstonia solanacearum]|uniref:heavy-metal-associated domain-containing protein n=1 Tax=Ralstonia solanacearum TaxID=305 RepID=UPI0009BB1B24|nr:heavy-metal-associated domain-containing protein [Ralstonia solanacearum]MDC6177060.1 heavy-metal-associated domain-containing protein [Ralstonia solanacearum]MDC6238408.1 heavy-metal-associated domain-containing protein [Ralstonia solanacearum]
MLAYRIDDMTCGHCASAITQAVRAVDAAAKVEVDLGQHLVRIESTKADSMLLSRAIREAGYTPVPIDLKSAGTPQPHAGSCCCCGSGASRCGA